MNPTTRPLSVSVIGQCLVGGVLAVLVIWFWQLQSTTWPSVTHAHGAHAIAAALSIAFVALLTRSVWPRRTQTHLTKAVTGRAVWHVFHASQTGFAFELAEQTVQMLTRAGHTARLNALDAFDPETVADARCLFVVSTTGEGDPPDPALAFVSRVMRHRASLQGVEYGLLALGDRSYAHYCAFGHDLDKWLSDSGALPIFDLIEVDNAAPSTLHAWQAQVAALTGAKDNSAFERVPFTDFRLTSRALLNPGSAGGAVFALALKSEGAQAQWRAGDIAEVQTYRQDGEPGPHREYSIASVAEEGQLSLLVRLMHDANGRPGLGSGWLCQFSQPGDTLSLRIRSNPNFHTPAGDVPLILIGNGTGIAGLRAHLKARIDAGHTRHWLLFGERNAAHDRFYEADITHWHAAEKITHLDRIFSRDADSPHRYVQEALAEHADRLQRWIDAGAVIMVCGSQAGMAPGVDAVLRDALGDDRVDQLLAEGRYRRDVY